MTTEDDFRRALNANPEDWQTLLVCSDWLRDRDDTCADGFAALARHRKCPSTETHTNRMKKAWRGDWSCWAKAGEAGRDGRRGPAEIEDSDALPSDWYDATKEANQLPKWVPHAWSYFRTRFDALNAAALGFAQLPVERRAELLAGTGAAPKAAKRKKKPKTKTKPKKEPKAKVKRVKPKGKQT